MIPYVLIIFSCLYQSMVLCLPLNNETFELSVIHINDFHASYQETNDWGVKCKSHQKCIGGFSRMYETIMTLKKNKPNSLLLNAGDNFQGTIWYTIFKWNVTQYFLNKIPFDAFTLGNHEFDDTVKGAVAFMKHIKYPFVLANVDDSEEPSFQGLYTKSIVLERNGRKIGIIGVLLREVEEKSKIGNLKFLDESESINKEAEKLVRDHDVFTNIVLSHCGYELEKELAEKATGRISLIVGGHSHSLLWTEGNPPSNAEKPEGPYPTVVKNKEGKSVLVVQALSTSRYVGNISLTYNFNGDVIDWSGKPVFQDSILPQNEEINSELKLFKTKLEERVNKVIGNTLTELSNIDCKRKECNLGNFVTDALVFNELQLGSNSWTNVPIAAVNCGSLKQSIPRGNVTYHDLLSASPFNNEVVVGIIQGKFLLQAFEHALKYFAEWQSRLLQVSGIKLVYDMKRPHGKRLISAKVRCSICKLPEYSDIEPNLNYSIVIPDFIANGGDGFTMLRDNFIVVRRSGVDTDILAKYVMNKSPIFEEIQGRIIILGDENIKSKYYVEKFMK